MHSFVCSLIHSLTHPPTHTHTHSLMHALTQAYNSALWSVAALLLQLLLCSLPMDGLVFASNGSAEADASTNHHALTRSVLIGQIYLIIQGPIVISMLVVGYLSQSYTLRTCACFTHSLTRSLNQCINHSHSHNMHAIALCTHAHI